VGFELTALVVIGTDFPGGCKSNYHKIIPYKCSIYTIGNGVQYIMDWNQYSTATLLESHFRVGEFNISRVEIPWELVKYITGRGFKIP
jgi:hypothetical protein